MIDWNFLDKFNKEEKVKQSQNFVEFDRFITWIKETFPMDKPVKYLEIGSYAGESLYYLSQILPRESRITLVDLGDNPRARAILERVIPLVVREFGMDVRLVSGDSRSFGLIQEVSKDAPYDLCFIDANHEFDYAFSDFKNYRGLSRFVAFHDISEFNTSKTKIKYGVYQANAEHIWRVIKELTPQRFWLEIVDRELWENTTKPEVQKPRGFGILNQAGYTL